MPETAPGALRSPHPRLPAAAIALALALLALPALFLVAEPVVMLGAAGWLTARWAGRGGVLQAVVRYSYALIPMGFGVWLAHYGFHFLTGLLTFIPVAQSAAAGVAGWPVLGEPAWHLTGLPERVVYPIELGFLGLGLLGSLLLTYRLAEDEPSARRGRVFAVWAALCVALWVSGFWLMSQPMEMRGTFLGN